MTEKLVRYGYTEREAQFLRIAALLGGYFLRRHFNEFIGRQCGALAQRFLERALRLGHLRAIDALAGRIVHHVSGSAIYSALGDPDNRNRREHQFESVRRRLIALDYVLGVTNQEPRSRWLLRIEERRQNFPSLALAGDEALNCLSDREPVRVLPHGGTEFTFIDEGLTTFSKWNLFLRSHRGLLKAISSPEVVFAGCRTDRLALAERTFRRTILGEGGSGGLDTVRLHRYFESRRLFERKELGSFDQAGLDEFRECRRIFAGDDFERLYDEWQKSAGVIHQVAAPSRVQFRAVVLPHSYEWLSPIRFQERRA